jgi:hypothetical protein
VPRAITGVHPNEMPLLQKNTQFDAAALNALPDHFRGLALLRRLPVGQIKRGEGMERVLQRLSLSETTWEDARVKYTKLAKAGI